MCGILGRFGLRGDTADLGALCAATVRLRHRGPDDGTWWAEGPWFLGHRRLSIIDVAGGQQPMASLDGRFVIVFNGEIYNYIELREELRTAGHRFRTGSDTEVLLAGYRAWGVDLPTRLVGMFAFALVDRLQSSLFLARDRFGEKPLFIHESPQAILFGSELGALASLDEVPLEVDPAALGGYLCLNYVPGRRTLLSSIERLPAASWRLYTKSKREGAGYWSPPPPLARRVGLAEAVEQLRPAIDDGVRLALRSDVPVALFLSGGIDSSVIAESASRQGRLRHAYCLSFPDPRFSELDKARLVARRLGLELRVAELTPNDLQDFLTIVEHADDPLADSSALAVWALARRAAQDYKVVISGDGGDELFGGYLTYKATAYHRLLTRLLPLSARRGLARASAWLPVGGGKVSRSYQAMRFLRAADLSSAVAHLTWNGAWLPSAAERLVTDAGTKRLARTALDTLVADLHLPASPGLADLQRADIREYLCNDILAKVDRMTMAHGLEARAPFLTPGVADLALSLPDELKIQLSGPPKRVLRAVAARVYGPEIVNAKKQGFSIPVHDWLRGPARPLVDDLLSPDSIRSIPWIDAHSVADVTSAHLSNRAQLGFELWGLMVLVAWYRSRVAHRPRAPRGAELRRVSLAFEPAEASAPAR